jgi:glutamyl-Q tRNA(Asp) synthetase
MQAPRYRGRFAPSPSGALHFGSLVAAVGSFLDARSQGGAWLLRIEDVDPPRVVAGAADRILRGLEAHGFEWDGAILWQSRRLDAYRAALADLRRAGLAYPCTCSRKDIQPLARQGVDGPVYPGTCRRNSFPKGAVAWRYRIPEQSIAFEDRQLGRVCCDVGRECGDFVLRRADGAYAYQLAVVVDDAEQGITDVVRGADLLTSTPRQIVLQGTLGVPTPRYLHLPVALDAQGNKLSKQTLATPIDDALPLPSLLAAAAFLAIPLPAGLQNRAEFWPEAIAAWPRRAPQPIRGKRPKPWPNRCIP